MRRRYALVLLYFGVALAAAWTVGELERPIWDDPAVALRIHEAVVEGTADYPHQFRPLVPFVCEAAFRAGLPLRVAYLLQRLVCWFLALLLLHQYLRAWLREELCLAGGLFLAAMLPFSVIATGFQPTDPLNLLLYVLAYRLLLARQDGWLLLLVAVGMFNRETIALVALLAAAVRLDEWRTPRYWALVMGLTAVAAAVYLGLHAWYGPRDSFTTLVTPRENIPANLTRFGSLRAVVVYGVLWWLALSGLREQPAFLRRSVILVPVFLVVHLAVGLLGETRYFLPLAPTILPLALRRLLGEPEVAA
ncbi:MAG: hypothetical protein HUU35_13205 [Armatimonadetes bacterium]|nr:hypothetical protein [Armatimonadota bacterium]